MSVGGPCAMCGKGHTACIATQSLDPSDPHSPQVCSTCAWKHRPGRTADVSDIEHLLREPMPSSGVLHDSICDICDYGHIQRITTYSLTEDVYGLYACIDCYQEYHDKQRLAEVDPVSSGYRSVKFVPTPIRRRDYTALIGFALGVVSMLMLWVGMWLQLR